MEPETSTTEKYQIEYRSTYDDQWYIWSPSGNSEEEAIDDMWKSRKRYPTITFRTTKLTTIIEHKVIAE
jgi:hypothetical protein